MQSVLFEETEKTNKKKISIGICSNHLKAFSYTVTTTAGKSPKKLCLPFKHSNTCTYANCNCFHHQKVTRSNKKKKMKELAKQELMTLEALYPTKFQCLKVQLKEFIHLLNQQDQQQQQSIKQQQQIHLSILTQESSSRKREREWEKDDGYSKRRRSRKKEGISGAMQKAEACLQKIQTLKSFFGSSNDH